VWSRRGGKTRCCATARLRPRPSARPRPSSGSSDRVSPANEACVWQHTFTDLPEARQAIASWIGCSNADRPHQAAGYRSPLQPRAEHARSVAWLLKSTAAAVGRELRPPAADRPRGRRLTSWARIRDAVAQLPAAFPVTSARRGSGIVCELDLAAKVSSANIRRSLQWRQGHHSPRPDVGRNRNQSGRAA
jgi:putative transposase